VTTVGDITLSYGRDAGGGDIKGYFRIDDISTDPDESSKIRECLSQEYFNPLRATESLVSACYSYEPGIGMIPKLVR
jgi:hypothetical protein